MSDVVDLPDTPPTLFVLHSCMLGFFSFIIFLVCDYVHVSFISLIAALGYYYAK